MSYPPQQPAPQWYYGEPPPRPPSGVSAGAILVLFVGVLLVLSLVGAIYILLSQPLPPIAPCEPGRACAPQPSPPPISRGSPAPTAHASGLPPPVGSPAATTPTSSFAPFETPTSDSPILVSGDVWQSTTLSYSFEFDSETFQLAQSSDEFAVFDVSIANATVVIVGASGDVSPSELIQRELTQNIDSTMIGRTPDRDPYDAVLGPSIGHVRGEGSVFSGTMLGSDGTPVAPGGVTIVAATDGRITAAAIVIVSRPDVLLGSDTVQYVVRQAADNILKTFDWDGSL